MDVTGRISQFFSAKLLLEMLLGRLKMVAKEPKLQKEKFFKRKNSSGHYRNASFEETILLQRYINILSGDPIGFQK